MFYRLRFSMLFTLIFILLCIAVSFNAYAKTDSFVNIISSQTGAKGSTYYYSGTTGNLYGWNDLSSTNALYCATDIGPTYRTMRMEVDSGVCTKTGFTISAGNYRVLLDPSGPLMSGCNGYGSFWQ